MEEVILNATLRKVTGKKVKNLRNQGKLPGILYGHKVKSTPITFDLRETTKTLNNLTSSSLVTIKLGRKKHIAIIREKQHDFIKGHLLHVDFQVVSLEELIRAQVNIELTGTAPAVKDFSGVVVTGLNQVEVECLTTNLPERFVLDISKLENIGDGIFVHDIEVAKDIIILNDPSEMIAIITGQVIEEEKEEAEVEEEEILAEEPEVIEHGKKEEGEEMEGEG